MTETAVVFRLLHFYSTFGGRTSSQEWLGARWTAMDGAVKPRQWRKAHETSLCWSLRSVLMSTHIAS